MSRRSEIKKILAVSSGGGHWMQLRRVVGAFDGHKVVFVTVNKTYRMDVPRDRVYVVHDATRWDRVGLVRLAFGILWVLLKERPDLVISTGAAPGCIAVILGRVLGARTIWLDSIANTERISYSGQLVRRFAGLHLTQWPHLVNDRGPEYAGRVF